MHSYTTFLALLLATSVACLPLNINLGAFSPALVVGDGEISFGGEEDVSNLMTALSGASQTAEAGTGIARAQASNGGATESGIIPAVVPVAEASRSIVVPADTSLGRKISTRGVVEDIVAQEDLEDLEDVEDQEDLEAQEDLDDAEDQEDLEAQEDLEDLEAEEDVADSGDHAEERRDLAGFTAALSFASEALKISPGVQLGTGEGGSGIGIIVEPGVNNPAAGGEVEGGAVTEAAPVVGEP